MVLLALINGVFDSVSLDNISKAETLIRKKSSQLPDEVLRRIFSSEALNDKDNAIILSLAKEATISITNNSEALSDE